MSKFHWSIVGLSACVMGAFVGFGLTSGTLIICAILLSTYAIWLFLAAMNIQWNFYAPGTHFNHTPQITLTFDDGPHPIYTPQILDALAQQQIKALFFIIGKEAQKHPEIVKAIHAQGHQIGIHTQNHMWNFGALSTAKVCKEITDCATTIFDITGVKPVFFRPPFGITNPRIARAIKKCNVQLIGWNVRSFDTQPAMARTWKKRVISLIQPGSMVLLHDRMETTAQQLASLISKIKALNYTFGLLKEQNH